MEPSSLCTKSEPPAQCSQTPKFRLPSCVKLHGAGAGWTNNYTGDGLRDSRTFNSGTTTFTWDVNRSIPQVLDDGNAQYTFGPGRIAKLEARSVGGSGTYLYVGGGRRRRCSSWTAAA